jgi:hypothetical protein
MQLREHHQAVNGGANLAVEPRILLAPRLAQPRFVRGRDPRKPGKIGQSAIE